MYTNTYMYKLKVYNSFISVSSSHVIMILTHSMVLHPSNRYDYIDDLTTKFSSFRMAKKLRNLEFKLCYTIQLN